MQNASGGLFNDPWSLGGGNIYNNDMLTVFAAEKIIEKFKPELLVVNMQDIDIAHNEATQYLNNLHKSDYALWHLWETTKIPRYGKHHSDCIT